MKVEESLNVTFDETHPSPKTSPLEDDDLVEEDAIKLSEIKPLSNDVENESLESNEIINIKESKSHPLENVIVLTLTLSNQTMSLITIRWIWEKARYTTDEELVMSEHEAINPTHTVNTQSFKEELSSKEDLDEWLKVEIEKRMSKKNEKNKEDARIAIIKSIREECRVVYKNKQISALEGANLKRSSDTMEDAIDNDSSASNLPSLEELNLGSYLLPFTINNYNSYGMANIDTSNNVMPRSIYEYLKLANLGRATISVKMDVMTQQETLGTMKNVLVKIDKFEFPCDFVVTDMAKNLGEVIILGRPFLETIHAQIDVFQEEISLRIGKDRIKFDSFKEELSSKEDLDEWLKVEIEKRMSKKNEKNKEDARIAIIKSIREECRVVYK
nr:hypothetical protein [Tanacetum cinerariifolium]